MKLTPRPYQVEAIGSIWSYFESNTGNPVVAMPTGTGKSVVIGGFAESVYRVFPSTKILVVTHVKELIQQNYEKMISMWPGAPAGIYSAGLNKRDTRQKLIFCGIGSVAKRAHEFGVVDLVIVDECDLVSPEEATMYQKFFTALKQTNPNLKIIGLSATIWRMGFGLITQEGGIFTDVCFDITTTEAFNRLIAEGYLAPLVPKKMRTYLDVEGVHMRGGEFIGGELEAAVDKEEITRAALSEAIEYKDTRGHWLVFSSGVDHAKHIADMLNEMGVSAKAVYSGMGDKARDDAIQEFKDGTLQALVNNNILTTGFDSPWVDMIVCLRPTMSSRLWVQMLGRGTRPYLGDIRHPPKENCLVLDFARNSKRLGPINDPVIPRKKGDKGGDAPVKECPMCECYVHASLRFCNGVKPNGVKCDYEFTFQTKLVTEASSDELIKGDMPVVEVFKVDHVTMTIYTKMDKPPMLKLAYFCGYRMFEEYVCVEHSGYAGIKAKRWLKERLPEDVAHPKLALEALAMSSMYKLPTHLRIWTNKKYPEILAYCFDGSAFGKEQPNAVPPPDILASENPRTVATTTVRPQLEDDDIPF